MATIFPILIVVFFVCYIANKANGKEEEMVNHNYDEVNIDMCNNQNSEEMKQEQNEEKPDTMGLMFNTLNQLGCQPTANDDGSISVQYQGENFHMEFGGRYACVWDPMWAGVKADDPNLPKIREAVNAANFNFGPTVVLTAPNDEGVIGFHSRRDIMLHPACPDNTDFVRAVLDSFFDTKERVRDSYQQINAKQMEAQKNRRPVGFATSSTSKE